MSTRALSGLIYGTPDAALRAYYRGVVRSFYRAGVQLAFRYF